MENQCTMHCIVLSTPRIASLRRPSPPLIRNLETVNRGPSINKRAPANQGPPITDPSSGNVYANMNYNCYERLRLRGNMYCWIYNSDQGIFYFILLYSSVFIVCWKKGGGMTTHITTTALVFNQMLFPLYMLVFNYVWIIETAKYLDMHALIFHSWYSGICLAPAIFCCNISDYVKNEIQLPATPPFSVASQPLLSKLDLLPGEVLPCRKTSSDWLLSISGGCPPDRYSHRRFIQCRLN